MRYRGAMKIDVLPGALALVAFTATAVAQTPSEATAPAPATFQAKFETTKGDVVFDCTREWAPNGVDRFYNLVKLGFFEDVAIFRVKHDFVAQFGIHGDPAIAKQWQNAQIQRDPAGKQSNKRGMLTFAMAGSPDSRTTQIFINYKDNSRLDGMGFAPICNVSQGMEVADTFFEGYGEQITDKQSLIQTKGNAYLRESWPNLDYIKSASIVGEPPPPKRGGGAAAAPAPEAGGMSAMWYAAGAGALAVAAFLVFRSRSAEPPPPPPPTKKAGKKKKAKKKTPG
jgi:peptidyl-prolyl cis-trans isomerase A (cyclophilin A)